MTLGKVALSKNRRDTQSAIRTSGTKEVTKKRASQSSLSRRQRQKQLI